MAKRINLILESETEQTINRAVQYYAATHSPDAIRERLKAAALRDRDLADETAIDWRAVDREAWQGLNRGERTVQRPTRDAERSTS